MRTLTPEGWREVSPYLDQVLSLPEMSAHPGWNRFELRNPIWPFSFKTF